MLKFTQPYFYNIYILFNLQSLLYHKCIVEALGVLCGLSQSKKFDYDLMHQLWNYIYQSLPKLVNIAPLKTCVKRVTASAVIFNTDYIGFKSNNIKEFW